MWKEGFQGFQLNQVTLAFTLSHDKIKLPDLATQKNQPFQNHLSILSVLLAFLASPYYKFNFISFHHSNLSQKPVNIGLGNCRSMNEVIQNEMMIFFKNKLKNMLILTFKTGKHKSTLILP